MIIYTKGGSIESSWSLNQQKPVIYLPMGFWSSEMGIELYQQWRKWAPENYRGSAVVSKCVATCCDILKACWTQDQQQTGYTIEILCPSNLQQETDIHWPQDP